MDNYRDFYDNFDRYGATDTENDTDEDSTEVDNGDDEKPFGFDVSGFRPIIEKSYDSIRLISERAAIGVSENRVYYIETGTERLTNFSASDVGKMTTFGDKYVVLSEGGSMRLFDYSGRAISDAYEAVSLAGNTAFLKTANLIDVVIDGQTVRRGVSGNYILTSESTCRNTDVPDTVYSVPDFVELRIDGMKVIDEPYEGVALVKRNGKIGYVDSVKGKILISPRYSFASQFSNGYAAVRANSSLDYPIIIDKKGNEIFDFGSNKTFTSEYPARNVLVYPCHENYVFFSAGQNSARRYGYVDILADKPEIVFLPAAPFAFRNYGGYAVLSGYSKLFDLSSARIVNDITARSIVPASDGFILDRNGKCDFIDFSLNLVAEGLDGLSCLDGLYSVCVGNEFYVCTFNDKILQKS